MGNCSPTALSIVVKHWLVNPKASGSTASHRPKTGPTSVSDEHCWLKTALWSQERNMLMVSVDFLPLHPASLHRQ